MAEKGDDITLTEGVKKTPISGNEDLGEFVHNILKTTQNQFETMSNKIISRIDDVSRRVDDLEKSITELMNQAGVPPDEKYE
ncbi:unnamed protein product [Bursaphelenchus xylophilus]|uniref:(pine wood nematode) hypothetical protein n=1 Tax=Bursaphelenchus xylophilus TaxID=6326 RepID=A0A7I8XBE4_BURXY|nr:unnamed protein product [Bursaphelenchus xylophilus]CAG9083839.1 unnamed protein product [Bursaphelenchus xylophilus]